ncbi:MAG TPA: type II secretion system protein N [Pseudomonadales bacterium]|nr:type II secretion system protein N [Pseudomonadales bacterium]
MSSPEANAPEPGRRTGPSRRLLVGFGLLAFLIVILVTAPAGVVARAVALATPQVRLLAPSGSLWHGSADLFVDARPCGRLAWEVRPGRLLQARLAADARLEAPGHVLTGRVALAPDGSLELSGLAGRVDERTLGAVLAPYDIDPAGEIVLTDGDAVVRDRRLVSASAHARWSGGAVRYRLAGQNWFATFPPLDAHLDARDGEPLLVIRDPQQADILDLRIDGDGWAHLRMRYRLAMLAGFPWPDPPTPDTIVVEVSEQIL